MKCKSKFGRGNFILTRFSNTLKNFNFVSYKNIILLVFYLLSFIFIINQVNALTGSGGTISVESEIGSISYKGSNSQIDIFGGSSSIYGLFEYSSIDGYFGLSQNSNNITTSLYVTNPSYDALVIGTSINFYYVPSGLIDNCSLYIDDTLVGFNANPYMGSTNIFTINSIDVGRHSWNISCLFNQYTLIESGEFTNIIYAGFNSSSTDMDGLNASAVPNFSVYENSGNILFDGYTDLSGGGDISSNIIISSTSVYINSTALPTLNRSAVITLIGVPFGNVLLWRDGVICDDCNILSLSGNTLIFNVTGFSNYSITSTSKLETYDTSDFSSILQNSSITFIANYTNITSGAPILGSCNITIFGQGTYDMTYNATSLVYYYNNSFENAGISQYTIQCFPIQSGYDSLEVSSTFVVHNLPPLDFASITTEIVNSSSMNLQNDAVPIAAAASNITELSFDTQVVTNTWQGYYGKLTGNIQLTDANASVMYNWELVSPTGEVYATRSPSVEWSNIRCANISELMQEDILLGVPSNASDSVVNTFNNNSNFDEFFTGFNKINISQNCYAIHLNDETGAQSTDYAEVLLSDSSLIVYTAMLDPNALGFDGNDYDFEMIVGENGHNDDTTMTTYYFYLEIS
ncbi:MAG: hypothetical protein ACP5N1_05485 [Candidatus Woesearchaeota archaeon]